MVTLAPGGKVKGFMAPSRIVRGALGPREWEMADFSPRSRLCARFDEKPLEKAFEGDGRRRRHANSRARAASALFSRSKAASVDVRAGESGVSPLRGMRGSAKALERLKIALSSGLFLSRKRCGKSGVVLGKIPAGKILRRKGENSECYEDSQTLKTWRLREKTVNCRPAKG